ncbi:C39 family peptidase [Heyndrickxia acidiproducens]|uniref:C39 family peptidase n=1 Tax=Heyndrickxia acidiproducens TaxID=1121084 RepID=UPI001F1B5A0F|nr:C39 family peptidase [Heyndrickxia acidiproducens]
MLLLAINFYEVHSDLPEKKLLDVPLVNQMDEPRLYNGCEITSLAMLLQDNGYRVTKNELAGQVKRVPLLYENGQHGNPNEGFVGDMENGPGLGVYHKPVYQLAKKYAGSKVKDLTNQSFSEVIRNIAEGHPVWVIVNTRFRPISNFQKWDTPQGEIKITYSEHSVVVTGYDTNHIFVNDPYGTKNKQLDREKFIKAWEQMGSQAIVIQ